MRFELGEPVRGFRWGQDSVSFAGWYCADTSGGHVGYESWLERDRLNLLDRDPVLWGSLRSRSGCIGMTAGVAAERACPAAGWEFSW